MTKRILFGSYSGAKLHLTTTITIMKSPRIDFQKSIHKMKLFVVKSKFSNLTALNSGQLGDLTNLQFFQD